MKPKICIFDVDGTLSGGFYLVKFSEVLYQEGMFSESDLRIIREILRENRKGNYPYEKIAWDFVKAFANGIQGKKRDDIEKIGELYIRRHPEEKFQFTDGLVRIVKDKGYRTVVISGSPLEIILPFSRSLEIDETFATNYETEHGIFTGEVSRNCAINGTKRQVVQGYLQEHDIDLHASAGFGDSHHDLAFLGIVRYPVAIKPNPELEKIAEENQWLVCKTELFKD